MQPCIRPFRVSVAVFTFYPFSNAYPISPTVQLIQRIGLHIDIAIFLCIRLRLYNQNLQGTAIKNASFTIDVTLSGIAISVSVSQLKTHVLQ